MIPLAERDHGFGRHIYVFPNRRDHIRVFSKILYIDEIGYYASITTVKLAILSFYRRIFPVRELRYLLITAFCIVMAFFLSSILVTTFQW